MRKAQLKIFAVGAVGIVLIFGIYYPHFEQSVDDSAKAEISEETKAEVAQQAQTLATSLPAKAGVITNGDGSVTVRGSASFTMAPLSSGRPPVVVPESEVKKLSSPK